MSPLVQSFKLTLASQSPRRKQLLRESGYQFDVIRPEESAEDPPHQGESPPDFVARVARQKAANVAGQLTAGMIIGSDTVADLGGTILGKPRDLDHAREMLTQLRGQIHHVYTGLCLWRRPDDQAIVRVASSKLRMSPISDRELEDYLHTDGWKGKAGAFGYQDRLGWVSILAGEESTVVGLPLRLLRDMLHEFGLTPPDPKELRGA